MLCPSCGEKNPLGVQHCQACAYPFTRAARASQQPAQRSAPPRDAYHSRRQPARSQRRNPLRWLVIIMLLLVIGAGAVVAGMLVNDAVVKPYVADQVSDDLDRGIREAVQHRIPATPIAMDGQAEVMITEDDINQSIASHSAMGPIDQATVDVSPEGIQIDLEAYGLSGVYSAELAVVDGQVQLQNGSIDGPIGMLLPTGELESVANQAINGSLSEAGYQVEQVTLSETAIALIYRR